MTPIQKYITQNEHPKGKNETRRLAAKVARFAMISRILYRRSFGGPYLKCITPREAGVVLSKLHEEEC